MIAARRVVAAGTGKGFTHSFAFSRYDRLSKRRLGIRGLPGWLRTVPDGSSSYACAGGPSGPREHAGSVRVKHPPKASTIRRKTRPPVVARVLANGFPGESGVLSRCARAGLVRLRRRVLDHVPSDEQRKRRAFQPRAAPGRFQGQELEHILRGGGANR